MVRCIINLNWNTTKYQLPNTDTYTILLYYTYKTASTQIGQFLNREVCKAQHYRPGPITFIAPLPTSPVDVQTAEPTLVDTSIVYNQSR